MPFVSALKYIFPLNVAYRHLKTLKLWYDIFIMYLFRPLLFFFIHLGPIILLSFHPHRFKSDPCERWSIDPMVFVCCVYIVYWFLKFPYVITYFICYTSIFHCICFMKCHNIVAHTRSSLYKASSNESTVFRIVRLYPGVTYKTKESVRNQLILNLDKKITTVIITWFRQ